MSPTERVCAPALVELGRVKQSRCVVVFVGGEDDERRVCSSHRWSEKRARGAGDAVTDKVCGFTPSWLEENELWPKSVTRVAFVHALHVARRRHFL